MGQGQRHQDDRQQGQRYAGTGMNLSQANRILDKACKDNGMDPTEVRMAMVDAIVAKHAAGKTVTCDSTPTTKVSLRK